MKQRKGRKWRTLENAAKIFPSNSHGADTKVFRYTCQLTEPVDPAVLQRAVDEILPEFPGFTSVLRQGFFWYYLEESDRRILVEPESEPLCAPLYKDSQSALLRVVYFDRRFSFEMFHVLADGTGAMQFFKALVCRYLSIAHAEELGGRLVLPDYDASIAQRMDDGYARYYDKNALRKKPPAGPKAAHLKLEKRLDHRMTIMEGRLPLAELKKQAKAHGATITIFLSAVLIQALAEQMPLSELKKPVMLSVPVDLRGFFPSETCRNFFSVFEAGSPAGPDTPLEEIIANVRADFERRLVKDHFAARLARLAAMERNPIMRIVPLQVKNIVLYMAYRKSEEAYTAAFSNVGRIVLPEELHPWIEAASACNATGKILLIGTTFGETVCLSFTSAYHSADVQRAFFTRLTRMGIPITITTNEPGEVTLP